MHAPWPLHAGSTFAGYLQSSTLPTLPRGGTSLAMKPVKKKVVSRKRSPGKTDQQHPRLSANARRRMQAVNLLAPLCPLLALLTSLQLNAIRPSTTRQYVMALNEVLRWLASEGLPAKQVLSLGSHTLDTVLTTVFEKMFKEGIPPASGSKALVSLLHAMPWRGIGLQQVFPQSVRSLRGWHQLMPAETRQLLP